MWSIQAVRAPRTLGWQDVLDGPEREQDQRERGVGGVKAVGRTAP